MWMPRPFVNCVNVASTTSEPPCTGSKQESNGTMSSGVVRTIVSLFYGNKVVERKFPRLLVVRCGHVTKLGQGVGVDIMLATSALSKHVNHVKRKCLALD